MNQRNTHALAILGLAGIAGAASPNAVAQDAPASQSGEEVETVVVTGFRRRSQEDSVNA